MFRFLAFCAVLFGALFFTSPSYGQPEFKYVPGYSANMRWYTTKLIDDSGNFITIAYYPKGTVTIDEGLLTQSKLTVVCYKYNRQSDRFLVQSQLNPSVAAAISPILVQFAKDGTVPNLTDKPAWIVRPF